MLFILLILSILYAVTVGSADLSVKQVYDIILYELFRLGDPELLASGAVHDIVWVIRLPRIMLGVGVGMGLAVVGVVMQAIVKNPLAAPYILGISSGASLGATLSILLGVGVNYILLNEIEGDDVIACDFYNIKFIHFYF